MSSLAQTMRFAANAEGFLEDPNAWNEDIAVQLAQAEGFSLTEAHWKVIAFCRLDFEKTGKSPTVRRITKVGGFSTQEIYALFPKGPGKLAAKVSGLPKPQGCI